MDNEQAIIDTAGSIRTLEAVKRRAIGFFDDPVAHDAVADLIDTMITETTEQLLRFFEKGRKKVA